MIAWFKTKLAKRALARADALRHAGQWPVAEAQYRKAIGLVSTASTRGVAGARQVAGEAHLALGKAYLQLRQATRSVSELDLACRMLPGNWEAFYYRGCGEGWLGNYAKAEGDFTEALSLNPTEARIYAQRGHAYFKAWRLDQALSDYLEAQRRGGLRGTDGLSLAALRLRRREFAEAESLLRPWAERGHPAACLWLGAALEQQGRWGAAAAVYERATHVKEIEAEASARLGVVYIQLRQYELAAARLRPVGSRGREDDSTLFYYGWSCYHLQRFEHCVNAWEELSRRRPEWQRLSAILRKAKYAWGCERARSSDYEAAISLWTDYFSGRENDTQLAQALAELHLRAAASALKRAGPRALSEAEKHLEAAWDLTPDDSRPPFYLALIVALNGNVAVGRELLTDALALDPHDQRLRYYLALLGGRNDEKALAEALQTIGTQNGSGPWARRAAESLAALYVAQKRWADAADALLSCADGWQVNSELLAACLFQAGRLEDLLRMPSEPADVCYWQGLGCARQGLHEQAMSKFHTVLARQPGHQLARQSLSTLHEQRFLKRVAEEDWSSAVSALTEARQTQSPQATQPRRFHDADTLPIKLFACLLAGRREDAVRILEEALKQRPEDGTVLHSMGLTAYYTARALYKQGRGEKAEYFLHRAVAAWVTILGDENFWEGWLQQVRKRYQTEVGAQDIASLRKQLEESLGKLLRETSEINSQSERLVDCLRVTHGLAGKPRDNSPNEVTSFDLFIRAFNSGEAVFVPVIPKGTCYPLREPARVLVRGRNRMFSIPVYEGGKGSSDPEEQGGITFELPKGVPTETPVEVRFNYDRFRMLEVVIGVQGDNHKEVIRLRREPHQQRPDTGRYRRHERVFHRELKAAAALQEFGGFTLSGAGGKRLICGPLMIELLGCQAEFGRFVAALRVRREDEESEITELLQQLLGRKLERPDAHLPHSSKKQRLRRYFSRLGAAQALLELSRPVEALAALADAACQHCRGGRQRGRPKAPRRPQVTVCKEDCPQFDQVNPGYAGTSRKGSHLKQDAAELAVEAHLAAAQLALTAAAMNTEAACSHWQDALALARKSGDGAQRQIVAAAVGRSQALCDGGRVDEAVDLLERAENICDARHRRELTGRLAEVLTNRGVAAANSKPRQWAKAVDDLRRAVSLSPHAVRTRVNLCLALHAWAIEHLMAGDESAAVLLLEEFMLSATETGHAGAVHPKLRNHFAEAASFLAEVHNARAIKMARAGDWPRAVSEIEAALTFAPHDPVLVENCKKLNREYAMQLIARGQVERAVREMEKLRLRFPEDWPARR